MEREQQQRENGGGDQAEAKAMSADWRNTPPLLSVHTIVSGASRSARRVNLTTGSRLMPEVHSNRATSCVAVGDHDVLDEVRRDRVAVAGAEEAGVHRMAHDGVHRDDLALPDPGGNPDAGLADRALISRTRSG